MISKIFNTIAFRLTVWFTGIFAVCATVTFILFYYLAIQTLQHQMDQELLDNASEFTAIIRRNGLIGARELAVVQAQAAGEKMIFFRLLYPTGEVFASSHMSYWKNIKVSTAALRHLVAHENNVFETIQMPQSNQKARILYSLVAKNVILQTGIAMDAYAAFLLAFKKVFIGAMGFIILFSAVAGWLLIQKALSGVTRITRTAQDITGSNLAARVEQTGKKDELDHLASTLNSMLDRIEALVKNNREITDNIAHDLKSPITRIRGYAEIAFLQEDNIQDYRTMAANTIEESDRLLDMINTMLLISKAQAREDDFDFKRINLSGMIREACDLFEPLTEDKQICFETAIAENIYIMADIRMFQRAFSNLLDNAIKYTPKNGSIRVAAFVRESDVIIEIADTGVGIDPVNHENIFKRFFRTESSRTSPGSGLGLSLARTVIRKHNGDICVQSSTGKGAVFTVSLPYDNFGVI
ncbi:MAG: HAMP domain-containing histidine kinase [Proteobacteria bacterium]|nr:HAMP domain-containing histidine kinase [Pseudomonadota bacterium]MBU1387691.1 HAMP domain-containing histidine kinase [Pseudomonadota bacterium]MBU1543723.1 HAMP domain-containing histidine kinase [Pseudomonadota bacterium]MBU2482214.1 HAMP domain-containing histidine kinase [Pseudomonadota bacterium]